MRERVLFIFTSEILGGHELMTLNLIKNSLRDKKVEISVPSKNFDLMSELDNRCISFFTHDVNHKKLEIFHTFFNPMHMLSCIFFLIKIRKKYSEIVIVQGDIELGSVFIIMSKLIGLRVKSYIPYAHSFKTMGAHFARAKDFLSQFVYRSCNEYITISECFCRDLLTFNPKARCSVIKNYVASPELVPHRECTDDEPFRLFLIGRVSFRQKGHDLLIAALKLIQKDEIQTGIEVHFIGDGPDLPLLKSLCLELPVFVKPIFHGWQSDCWSIAYMANLIVIPSRYEGVPLVMLEAIARKVPVIASNRDGMVDYLDSRQLFEPNPISLKCLINDAIIETKKN
ncbi:glycosyltransferase [Aeromonas sp. 96A]|uniref:glycosyltransferase n=1 Tax=Aeromonas sp. 96A TaxID=3452730 RepID=UPI003F79AC84